MTEAKVENIQYPFQEGTSGNYLLLGDSTIKKDASRMMSCRQNCCNFCDNDLMHLLSQVVVIKRLLLGSLPPSPSSMSPPSLLMSPPPRCHRLPFIEITAFITVNIFVCQFLSKITVQILQSQLTQ